MISFEVVVSAEGLCARGALAAGAFLVRGAFGSFPDGLVLSLRLVVEPFEIGRLLVVSSGGEITVAALVPEFSATRSEERV